MGLPNIRGGLGEGLFKTDDYGSRQACWRRAVICLPSPKQPR